MRLSFLFVLVSILIFGCIGLDNAVPKFGPGGLVQPDSVLPKINKTNDDLPPKLPDDEVITNLTAPLQANYTNITNTTNTTGPKVYTNESPPVPSSGGGYGEYPDYTPPAPSNDELPPLPD